MLRKQKINYQNNQNYRWTHRDYQDAKYYEMNMQEIIDNDRYLIELNGLNVFLLLLAMNTVINFTLVI